MRRGGVPLSVRHRERQDVGRAPDEGILQVLVRTWDQGEIQVVQYEAVEFPRMRKRGYSPTFLEEMKLPDWLGHLQPDLVKAILLH